MNDILIIYSGDEDLKFLEPLVELLIEFLGEKVKLFRLDTTMESHILAQQQILLSHANTLLIIFCHGGSNYVLGNRDIEGLHVNDDHYEFLNSNNIAIVENKKIICLSCNSKEGFGDLVANNNGLGLVGFGDIQFDDPRLLKKKVDPDKQVQEISKRELVSIFFETIKVSFVKKASLKDFVNYFKLITNKHSDKLILENKGNLAFIRSANFLWHLKNDISLFGNKEIKLFEN